MVNQIELYGMDFWEDYRDFLNTLYKEHHRVIAEYFSDAVISYFRDIRDGD